MDVTEYEHIDVWRSACVGGGSVVFTGAMQQQPRNYFDGIWNWDVVRASCAVGRRNLGNSNGAKFDLNQNYLLQAKATGKSQIYPGHEVKGI